MTFVIDQNRKVVEVVKSEIRMNVHADRALDALKQLQQLTAARPLRRRRRPRSTTTTSSSIDLELAVVVGDRDHLVDDDGAVGCLDRDGLVGGEHVAVLVDERLEVVDDDRAVVADRGGDHLDLFDAVRFVLSSGTAAPRSGDGEPVVFHTVGVQLPGFTESTFTHDGLTRPVYAGGTGPAVIVIHEVPGLHPQVVEFAQRVVDAGFSVRMPSLFGTPGREVERRLHDRARWPRRAWPRSSRPSRSTARARSSAGCAASPPRRTPSAVVPGVGAVGMCFTGGFALGMMVDDTMLAPVLSQPSLPFPVSRVAPARRSASATPTSPG